jgi:carboxymethylenebutenolidase
MGTMIDVPTTRGDVHAYEARPDGESRGGIIVIHEVWGLVDHTKDVANRLAAEGYVALAPDLLSDAIDVKAAGVLQEDLFNPEKRNAVQPRLREITAPMHSPAFASETLVKLDDCFSYLHDLPEVNQKIAIIGFCFGGTYSFGLATKESRLKLAMPFYGHADGYSPEELKEITCPVRAFYGEKDEGLVGSLPDLKEKMQSASVDFGSKVYPDCGHAFFNDTNRFAYNKAAATDAWQRILEYLKMYV